MFGKPKRKRIAGPLKMGGWSLSESESKYEKKFTTKCGHTFCKPCLDTIHWWPDSFYKRPKSKHPIPNHISHRLSKRDNLTL